MRPSGASMVVALLALLLSGPAGAGETTTLADGWVLDTWGVDDGLPIERINDLTIDADGYVWLATSDGLVRFDGGRFETLRSDHALGPPSTPIRFVVAHPTDGSIWVIDAPRRLQRRLGATVTTFDVPELLAVQEPIADDETIWLAVEGGLARLESRPRLIPVPEGQPLFATPDPSGDLHLRTSEHGLWRLRASGAWERVSDEVPAPGTALRLAPSGEPTWLDGDGLAWRLDPELGQLVEVPEPRLRSARAPAGLLRWHAEGGEIFFEGAHVASVESQALRFVEHGDAVWIGTASTGLARLRRAALRTTRHPDGGPTNVERLWWDESGQTLWAVAATQGWWPVVGAGAAPPPEIATLRPAWPDGERWWLGGYGPARLGDIDASEVLQGPDGPVEELLAVVELPDGSWLFGSAGGLFRGTSGSTVVEAIATGRGAVRDVRLEHDRLWIGTVDHGLCIADLDHLSGEAWRCLGPGSTLDRSVVHATVSDERRTWVSTNRGIGVLDTEALLDFAGGGPEPAVLWLGRRDGMRTAEANGYLGGGAARTPDGRLWFATQDGVVEVDPADLGLPEPPRARIAEVRTGEAVQVLPDRLDLATDPGPLSILLDAPALDHPEQLVFRYRLGREGAWSAPSASRQLELPTVPAGEHRLEVQARLGGAWGPSADIVIARAPAWHERRGFAWLVALATAVLVGGAFHTRNRVLARLGRQLEARVQEQTRDLAAKNRLLAAQNEELAQLDALKRQLIANVSHELRTPLALIMGPLGTLLGRLGDDPSSLRALRLALDNAERLEQLIGQLFALTRAQAGGLRLQARRVEPGGVASQVLARFEAQAAGQGVRLALEPADTPTWVWLERDLIDKVLSNLVSNALRHAPAGSAVTVRLLGQEDHLRLEVEDEGPGVAQAHRGSIFERFVQVDEGGARSGGAGIGLALVKELVELHGGGVGVDDGVVGARFWLTLPFGAAHLAPDDIDLGEAPSDVVRPSPTPVGASGGARVLLAEDHDQLRGYLAEVLREDFRVTEASDGEVALRHAEAAAFDIVVTDIMMPKLDGRELVRRLRVLPGRETVPVLFISARGGLDDRLDGLGLADDYLAKPFQAPELVARVHALLRRSRQGARRASQGVDDAALRLEAELRAAAEPRLNERDFNAGALAKAAARSPRALQLHMQAAQLPTPGAWLRRLRLQRAEALLASGAYGTVAEVAAAVGMDRAYFSRAYRAHTGRTPGEDLARPTAAKE